MTITRRPRIFLSYRHAERRGLFAESYNLRHRAWVEAFARSLATWNVDVIWDGRLRDMFRPLSRVDPNKLAFLAEVSTLCLQSAQVFVPVLTRGYMERIARPGAHGTVSEEWRHALAAHAAKKLEITTVVREWPVAVASAPPAPITRDTSWDFRFVDPVRDEVELFGDGLHLRWDVERPPIDIDFNTLISTYVDFCRIRFNLPWPGIETWGCDFSRTDVFLAVAEDLAREGIGIPAEEGRGRDMDEIMPRSNAAPLGGDGPFVGIDDETPEVEAAMNAEALAMVQRLGLAHMGRYHKPFEFGQRKPAGRASKGLYFGSTLPGFSYLWSPELERHADGV